MQTATLVADPSRDTDMKPEVETGLERLTVAREAMQYSGREFFLM